MKETGNEVVSSDFLRVLLTLKDNIMNSTHVCELCKVVDIRDKKTIQLSLLNDNKSILYAYNFFNLELTKNQIVLVIFTDSDNRINLSRSSSNVATQTTNNNETHSIEYGIILDANTSKINESLDALTDKIDDLSNKIDEINNKQDDTWQLIYNIPINNSNINTFDIKNVFDFNNYDYKLESVILTAGEFPSSNIQISLLYNNELTTQYSAWSRISTDANFVASGGTVQNPTSVNGYGKNQQETIVDYGFDANDGSGAEISELIFTTNYDVYNNKNIAFKRDTYRNSSWCQQHYIVTGDVNSFSPAIPNGIRFYSSNSNFRGINSYIKIYRKKGGWNKFGGTK